MKTRIVVLGAPYYIRFILAQVVKHKLLVCADVRGLRISGNYYFIIILLFYYFIIIIFIN